MSERKGLTKYYPPDFDPSKVPRRRNDSSDVIKDTDGPGRGALLHEVPVVRRVNRQRSLVQRKEMSTGQSYLGRPILRFWIRCPRCSAGIAFRTDPKNSDYAVVSGTIRNADPRPDGESAETDEQRLDRLKAEAAEANGKQDEGKGTTAERVLMEEMETRTEDATREMAVADALDKARLQNSARARASMQDFSLIKTSNDEARQGQDRQDTEEAQRAFEKHRARPVEDVLAEESCEEEPHSSLKAGRPAKR